MSRIDADVAFENPESDGCSAHAPSDSGGAPEWLGTGELGRWLAWHNGAEDFLNAHSDGIRLVDVMVRMSFYLIDLVGDIDLAERDEIEAIVREAVEVVSDSITDIKCGNFWELYCDYVRLGFADPARDEALYRPWVDDCAADPERIPDAMVTVEEDGGFGEWFDRLFLLDGVRVFDVLMNTYEYLL